MTTSHSSPQAPADVERLYREHGRRVLGYALRRVGTREDALDVVAETFLITWRRRDQVPDDPDHQLPWLLSTARNCARNAARGSGRADRARAAVVRELQVLDVPDPADVHQVRAAHADLAAALATLSDDDRELVMLVSWDGLGPSAAGAALGLTPGAARVRLHRARARLRAQLDIADDREGTHR